jgi:hypothetical protein
LDKELELLRQCDSDDSAVDEGVGLAGGSGIFLSAMGHGNAMEVSRLGDMDGR